MVYGENVRRCSSNNFTSFRMSSFRSESGSETTWCSLASDVPVVRREAAWEERFLISRTKHSERQTRFRLASRTSKIASFYFDIGTRI
jgi:hypothetical protein